MPTLSATHSHSSLDQSCPTCGGLECLCRPRFFAGQLLSEEDLRALDHYIVEKNKLHNRYLHGTGVVCGLEVVCHDCKGWVRIKQGYALDPCGNDIILCEDYSFDLCAKIKECCDRKRDHWECEPMSGPSPDCKDLPQHWYVTLRYREYDSRGITALKSSSQPSGCGHCGCTPGNCRGGCGCGCHRSNGNGHSARKPVTSSLRRPPAQCEPTRVCEGFSVELAPAPPIVRLPANAKQLDLDALAKIFSGTCFGAIFECADETTTLVKQTPEGSPSLDSVRTFKRKVWEFLRAHPLAQCQMLDEVNRIPLAKPTDSAPALAKLGATLGRFLHDCICRAVLPSCLSDPGDPRVILACVTVVTDGPDCRILNICHERGRRFVLTSPNVLYWASLGPLIKRVLENACCKKPEEGGSEIAAGNVTDSSDLSDLAKLMKSLAKEAESASSPLAFVSVALKAILKSLKINVT